MLERRFINQQQAAVGVVNRAEGDAPVIHGYAALYYDGTDASQYDLMDDMVERIMPGAFDRAAREDDVRGLFNHDPNIVLGRTKANTLRLATDAKGLKYEIDPPDTQWGRDTVTTIRRGDVSGSSFAFDATTVVWRQEDELFIREIHEVTLYDVAPATYPAYESTTSGVRSQKEHDRLRAELDAWRGQQQGMSQHELDRIDVRTRLVALDG